eukprot:11765633-Ditylum_brightwellii.AAC.1
MWSEKKWDVRAVRKRDAQSLGVHSTYVIPYCCRPCSLCQVLLVRFKIPQKCGNAREKAHILWPTCAPASAKEYLPSWNFFFGFP